MDDEAHDIFQSFDLSYRGPLFLKMEHHLQAHEVQQVQQEDGESMDAFIASFYALAEQ